MKILLASQSPRRRELLAGLDIPFSVVSVHSDESYPPALQGGDIPLFIAREKAQAYTHTLAPDEVLITADTIVWSNGQVLGKPHDEQDAKRMLRLLSGKTHQVYTGVCFRTAQGIVQSFVDCTDVTFRLLTDEEIDTYVSRYQPLDKAGAYGIQEWIGYIAVSRLEGSYFNVMGFPVDKVYAALQHLSASGD